MDLQELLMEVHYPVQKNLKLVGEAMNRQYDRSLREQGFAEDAQVCLRSCRVHERARTR